MPERTQKMLSIGSNVLTETFRGLNVLIIGGAIKSIGKAATEAGIRALEELTAREVSEEVGYLLRQNTDEAASTLTKLFRNPGTKEQALRSVESLEDTNEIAELFKRGLIDAEDLARVPFKAGTDLEKIVEAAQLKNQLTGQRTAVLGHFSGGTENFIGRENLNILNFDDTGLSYEQIWDINKAWLDDAIKNGDDILLVTENPIQYRPDGNLTYYSRERSYLEALGYKRIGNYMKKVIG